MTFSIFVWIKKDRLYIINKEVWIILYKWNWCNWGNKVCHIRYWIKILYLIYVYWNGQLSSIEKKKLGVGRFFTYSEKPSLLSSDNLYLSKRTKVGYKYFPA